MNQDIISEVSASSPSKSVKPDFTDALTRRSDY